MWVLKEKLGKLVGYSLNAVYPSTVNISSIFKVEDYKLHVFRTSSLLSTLYDIVDIRPTNINKTSFIGGSTVHRYLQDTTTPLSYTRSGNTYTLLFSKPTYSVTHLYLPLGWMSYSGGTRRVYYTISSSYMTYTLSGTIEAVVPSSGATVSNEVGVHIPYLYFGGDSRTSATFTISLSGDTGVLSLYNSSVGKSIYSGYSATTYARSLPLQYVVIEK